MLTPQHLSITHLDMSHPYSYRKRFKIGIPAHILHAFTVPLIVTSFPANRLPLYVNIIRNWNRSIHRDKLLYKIKYENEMFALLGCYAASIGSYRCYGTAYWPHRLGSSSRENYLTLEEGTDRPCRNVGNKYKLTLCNVQEERRASLHSGGTLKLLAEMKVFSNTKRRRKMVNQP